MPPNEVVVTIAVDQANKKLAMYPRREGEVVVYKKFSGSHAERPTQVRWVSVDLQPNQDILIEAKNQTQPTFDQHYTLTAQRPEVVSGQPNKNPGPNELWSYTVYLMEGGLQKDKIDPDITVKDDP